MIHRCAFLQPMEVMDMLDRLYVKFDELSNKHELFKVPLEHVISVAALMVSLMVSQKRNDESAFSPLLLQVETIGDAYMAVANLAKKQPNHAARVARFALDAIEAANSVPILVCCDASVTIRMPLSTAAKQ